MNQWRRLKKLFSEPEYRRSLAYFIVLGLMIFLCARLIENEFWSNLLIDFAVVFIAVGLVDATWNILGGDPMELQMLYSFKKVDEKLNSIHSSIGVLSDIVDNNIGIERIWSTRRAWESDPEDGKIKWIDRICRAKKVDIVSNTLWDSWFSDEIFRRKVFNNVVKGSTVRILIYDPQSEVLDLRARIEGDFKRKDMWEMESEIMSTLNRVAVSRARLDNNQVKNLQLRLTNQYYQFAQIIRADELMLVATYLSGKTGSPSPTFQIRGPETVYFLTYCDQIDILWKASRKVSQDEYDQWLEKSIV